MIKINTKGAPIYAWTEGVQFEDAARAQVEAVAALPIIYDHVAVMPDVHAGIGCTVGSVIATVGAVIPSAVGVDIGCGMTAVRTKLRAKDLPDSLAAMRAAIEAAVPHGRDHNGGPGDRGAWGEPGEPILRHWQDGFEERYSMLVSRHPGAAAKNTCNHLGTLGTGNHFIEICLDERDDVWVMLHSGSRGLGNRIGSYFIARAREEMLRLGLEIPGQDLAYFRAEDRDFLDYVDAVGFAQDFAATNRELMLAAVLDTVATSLGRDRRDVADPHAPNCVSCHHNYLSWSRSPNGKAYYVTRKGAVSARFGQLGIIPGAMGRKSYIVVGKGNPDSFESCSHGAGRAMSRGEAKRRFTVEDHARDTAGLECRKDADVVDETPRAYKDLDAVMAAQKDLVAVLHELHAVLCVKG